MQYGNIVSESFSSLPHDVTFVFGFTLTRSKPKKFVKILINVDYLDYVTHNVQWHLLNITFRQPHLFLVWWAVLLFLQISMTYSFTDAEFLQLQNAELQSVLESLVFELHGPCVCGHVLRMRRWAVRACVMQQKRRKMHSSEIMRFRCDCYLFPLFSTQHTRPLSRWKWKLEITMWSQNMKQNQSKDVQLHI